MNYKSFDKNKFIKLFEKKQRTSQSQLKLLEDIKQLNYLKRKILKPLLWKYNHYSEVILFEKKSIKFINLDF